MSWRENNCRVSNGVQFVATVLGRSYKGDTMKQLAMALAALALAGCGPSVSDQVEEANGNAEEALAMAERANARAEELEGTVEDLENRLAYVEVEKQN